VNALISSDIHGDSSALHQFADHLRSGFWDIGILAGDILDDSVGADELEEMFALADIHPDELIPELIPAEMDEYDWIDSQLARLKDPEFPLMKALMRKEDQARAILRSARRPIYLIPGNHDLTPWESDDLLINIHQRNIRLEHFDLVGYRWTRIDRRREDHLEDLAALKHMVGKRTILVSHEPPYGTLDKIADPDGTCRHLGSIGLSHLVGERNPAWHIFGHVHSRFGLHERSVNVAYASCRRFASLDFTNGAYRIVA
jgi:Icc-related predicted phosphoesterase